MEDDKEERRRVKRRNYINRDLRDLRGPYSPKTISDKKKEAYKREYHKDYTIDDDEGN